MLKKLLFILTLIALTPTSALAQMQGYLGTDGYFHIKGLQANTKYTIDLGGMPIIKAANSNSCGILRIAASGTIKQSDRIEIKDEKLNLTYGFTNTNIPIKETAKCDGTIKAEREIWNDDKGTTYISGLSPSSAQTIRLLTSAPTRNIRANICGFLSFKLGEPRPGAIIIENQAFVLSGLQSGGGIACRKGKLFVAYPAPVLVAAVSAVTWRSQNPISFSSNTRIASISGGGGTSWSPPPSNPNPGGGGSSATCPTGTTGTPPDCVTPPPPTCPTGTTGTPPNCVAPPPPPPPPPVEPPATCPTGTTGTPPNCVTPKPTPVSGRMCKYAGTLVAIGLPPNKELLAVASEHGRNDRYATSDSGGWVQFDNFNYNATYEGDPASVVVQYKKDNGNWENVDNYPGYSGFPNFVYIPSIGPCK
ncbi:hypothetical protein [Nostoc sp. JL33]|uniref:hypothetical protein n=1 Tax=Nostoc sp. JL33 TaxID=2815396 RepID=UPI0025EA7609|nr:hypothetical protein [Nostoc sp. JL33]MBN3871627.1 hypothetical protein [Nostoc sp. JL33]